MKTRVQRFGTWPGIVWLGTVLLLLAPVTHGREASQQEEKTTPSYEELLARLKSGDEEVDIRQLRFAQRGTGNERPYRSAMFKALMESNYEEVLRACNSMIEENYLSVDGHNGCSIGYKETGNASKMVYHRTMLEKLLRSITREQNGRSIETAWEVISNDEEEALIRAVGYRVTNEAIKEQDGIPYDVFTVTTREGETFDLYININHHFGGMLEMLGGLGNSRKEDK